MAERVKKSGEKIVKFTGKKASKVEYIVFVCYGQALNSSNKCM